MLSGVGILVPLASLLVKLPSVKTSPSQSQPGVSMLSLGIAIECKISSACKLNDSSIAAIGVGVPVGLSVLASAAAVATVLPWSEVALLVLCLGTAHRLAPRIRAERHERLGGKMARVGGKMATD